MLHAYLSAYETAYVRLMLAVELNIAVDCGSNVQ
jgi:hypothetical protein